MRKTTHCCTTGGSLKITPMHPTNGKETKDPMKWSFVRYVLEYTVERGYGSTSSNAIQKQRRKSHLFRLLFFTMTADWRRWRFSINSMNVPSIRLVMSMGYSNVVTEDTETLVDAAVSLLKELRDVFAENDEEKNGNFHAMLENMVSLMSVRVWWNLSTGQEKRQQILGDTSTQLQFLYCSAHFLLGFTPSVPRLSRQCQMGLR